MVNVKVLLSQTTVVRKKRERKYHWREKRACGLTQYLFMEEHLWGIKTQRKGLCHPQDRKQGQKGALFGPKCGTLG